MTCSYLAGFFILEQPPSNGEFDNLVHGCCIWCVYQASPFERVDPPRLLRYFISGLTRSHPQAFSGVHPRSKPSSIRAAFR